MSEKKFTAINFLCRDCGWEIWFPPGMAGVAACGRCGARSHETLWYEGTATEIETLLARNGVQWSPVP